MATSIQLQDYLALLRIRQRTKRRDMIVTGGLFLISLISMLAFGILGELESRSIYLITAIVVGMGFSYIMTWVKLEVINGSIETIETLQRAAR